MCVWTKWNEANSQQFSAVHRAAVETHVASFEHSWPDMLQGEEIAAHKAQVQRVRRHLMASTVFAAKTQKPPQTWLKNAEDKLKLTNFKEIWKILKHPSQQLPAALSVLASGPVATPQAAYAFSSASQTLGGIVVALTILCTCQGPSELSCGRTAQLRTAKRPGKLSLPCQSSWHNERVPAYSDHPAHLKVAHVHW